MMDNPAADGLQLWVDEEGIAHIVLDRDEKRNALSQPMIEAITAFISGLDPASAGGFVHVVLITARGSAFCAGADLGVVRGDSHAYHAALEAMAAALVACPLPVMASVQGAAVGAGVELILGCDLVIAAPTAWFRVPPAVLGFALDEWSVSTLVEMVGRRMAAEILLSAAKIPAERAQAAGLISRIGSDADALAWAREVAALAPLSLKQLKQLVHGEPFDQELYDEVWRLAQG